MRVADGLRRSGIAVSPASTVQDAAAAMEQAGVGALAVVEDGKPVGILTDRDLVRRAMARRLPPDARVDGVMSSPVVTIDADADLHDAYGVLRTHGIRRLAVVRHGRFEGMLTVDDLLVDLAGDLEDLSRPVTGEILFPQRDARVPATEAPT